MQLKRGLCQKHCKNEHGAIQIQGGSLWPSLIIQVNDAAVSQLHTHAGWFSSSAVLHPWSWMGLPEAAGPVPLLAWGGESGAKNRWWGAKGGLGHSSDGWRGGRGRVKKVKCEEHWEGQLLPLVPSQQEPLPCIPPPLPRQLYLT